MLCCVLHVSWPILGRKCPPTEWSTTRNCSYGKPPTPNPRTIRFNSNPLNTMAAYNHNAETEIGNFVRVIELDFRISYLSCILGFG